MFVNHSVDQAVVTRTNRFMSKSFNFFWLLVVLFLLSCSRQLEKVDSISRSTDIQIDTVRPTAKKILSWTKENLPFYSEQNMEAVDTIIYSYDSLSRLVLINHIVDPIGDNYWSSDSLRFVYSHNEDSLAYQIDYSTYKNGLLRSDTISYTRDSLGKVVLESAKYTHNADYNRYTSYIYNDNGTISSMITKNEIGVLKKKILWTYQDSIRRTIKHATTYKSGGHVSFINVDTIDICVDGLSTKISDYSTNDHGNKYLKNGRCANCIKIYVKNTCGKLVKESRIKRPSDTIYTQLIKYDRYCDPIRWTTKTKNKTVVSTSTISRDRYGFPIMAIDSTDNVHVSTTWRKYEY